MQVSYFLFALIRNSGGESGSADTVRDPRGFAVKLYTEEGNWDLVGNNTPIFFIRDPLMVSCVVGVFTAYAYTGVQWYKASVTISDEYISYINVTTCIYAYMLAVRVCTHNIYIQQPILCRQGTGQEFVYTVHVGYLAIWQFGKF